VFPFCSAEEITVGFLQQSVRQFNYYSKSIFASCNYRVLGVGRVSSEALTVYRIFSVHAILRVLLSPVLQGCAT